jgi:CHAT domain-containing protein
LHAAGIYDTPQPVYCADYVISSYIPSLTSLLRAQRKAVPLHRRDFALLLVAEKKAHDPNLATIPQVEDEINIIATAAESNGIHITQRVLGRTTVEGTSSAMETSNIVHLACHGTQDQRNPIQSGFYLGNGRLTIKRLMELRMNNPLLAFLSACETATGDNKQPDQVMHMAAAMLFCGFKGVIATMWSVIFLNIVGLTDDNQGYR